MEQGFRQILFIMDIYEVDIEPISYSEAGVLSIITGHHVDVREGGIKILNCMVNSAGILYDDDKFLQNIFLKLWIMSTSCHW